MSSRYQHERSPGGLDAIRLQNDRLNLAIVPQAGGKIIDLIDRCSGRNWLWKNPHIPVAVVELSYCLRNESDEALPRYWCAHPLRAEDAETRLRSSAPSEQRWLAPGAERRWSLQLELDQ